MKRSVGRLARLSLGALLTLGAAASAAMFSASFALEPQSPALALKLDPDNPEAVIAQIEAQRADPGADIGQEDVLAAARRSIAVLPLNAPAFRLFAGSSATGGEIARFEDQVAMSDRLSRRDLTTQLFLIEAAVERSDIRGALRHYDTAMRISESSRNLLFPVLSSAIKAPEIRAELVPYFDNGAPWVGGFIQHAINATADPRDLVRLLDAAGGMPEGKFFALLQPQLLNRLVNEGEIAAASAYFRSLRPDLAQTLSSFAMTGASTNAQFAPVTWQLFESDQIASMFLAAPKGDFELVSELERGFAGPVARRLAALAPGQYRLSVPVRAEDVPPGSTAGLQIACVSGDRSEQVLERTSGIADTAVIEGDFTIPSWCKAQMLTLSARMGFEPARPVLTFESPKLTRR